MLYMEVLIVIGELTVYVRVLSNFQGRNEGQYFTGVG